MLNDYCGLYRAVYQQPDETVEELIPFMLAAFMEADPLSLPRTSSAVA
jgi:hypothetical protein